MTRAGRSLVSATEGRAALALYAGGAKGDERDVVRKMKLGELDAAALTSVGLSLIYPGLRIMELPFLFESVEEVDYVRDRMWDYFAAKLAAKGFVVVARGDVGWTYLFTRAPVRQRSDLRGLRLWAWQDDAIVRSLYRRFGIAGVPMGLPDALGALESGRVDGCYGSPLAAVALQWHTRVAYATSMPVAYSAGAMVIRKPVWDAWSEADRAAATRIFGQLGTDVIARVRGDNRRALRAMTAAGLEIVPTPAALARDFQREAMRTWDELVGAQYTREELTTVLAHRAAFRARAAARGRR